jgi:hypothetical protein
MNLWVNRIQGQLTVLAVALFFFSCEDEANRLGYPNPNSKFDLKTIDIPVTSSILLLDSVRTSNYDAVNDVNRFLVGRYNDSRFGDIASATFAELLPADTLEIDTLNNNGVITRDDAVFDSVSIQFRHDFYVYGAAGNTQQQIAVHEVTERLVAGYTVTKTTHIGGQQKPQEITYPQPQLYLSKTTIPYNPVALGTKTYGVDRDKHISYAADATPPEIITSVNLDPAFGQRLFDLIRENPDSAQSRAFFQKHLKGIAIIPQGDKVIGFNPADALTRLEIHYHTTKEDSLMLPITFAGLVSYNQITADRAVSELSGLNTFYQDTDLGNDLRYVQAGTGVVTKIDFSAFKSALDGLGRVVINDAEFIIKDVEDGGVLTPPGNLAVKLINNNNRFIELPFPGRSGDYQTSYNNIASYEGFINFNNDATTSYSNYFYFVRGSRFAFDSTFFVMNDNRTFLTLNYSADTKTYRGSAPRFFQQLFLKTGDTPLFTKAILLPYAPAAASSDPPYGRHIYGKMLNRAAFRKDNIILRVYYTTPAIN